MMFAKLTVLMLIIRANQCIEPEVCSNGDDVFRGIAKDRYVISNSKTVRLDAIKLSSVCDAGVNCEKGLSLPYLIFHSGVTKESVVQLLQTLRSAT